MLLFVTKFALLMCEICKCQNKLSQIGGSGKFLFTPSYHYFVFHKCNILTKRGKKSQDIWSGHNIDPCAAVQPELETFSEICESKLQLWKLILLMTMTFQWWNQYCKKWLSAAERTPQKTGIYPRCVTSFLASI
jgi:hypothetical protein